MVEKKIAFYSQGRDEVILNGISDRQRFWLGVLDTVGQSNLANVIFSREFDEIKKADQERRKESVVYYALPV